MSFDFTGTPLCQATWIQCCRKLHLFLSTFWKKCEFVLERTRVAEQESRADLLQGLSWSIRNVRESARKADCRGLPRQCVHWPPWKIDRVCRYTLAFKTRISMNSIDFICNVVAIKDTSCMVHCHPIDWTTGAEIRRYRMVGAKIVYRTVAWS